jgi:hypothetical protein
MEMMAERAARLTALGFVWELSNRERSNSRLNDAAWEAELTRLAVYKAAHGDCNVPWGWAKDPRLGRWVMTQRNLKWKLDRGFPSEGNQGMTAARAARLLALGFV